MKIDQIQDHGTEFGPILLRRISEDYNIQILKFSQNVTHEEV